MAMSRTIESGEAVLGLSLVWQLRIFNVGRGLLVLSVALYVISYPSTQWIRRNYTDSSNVNPRMNLISTDRMSSFGIWSTCDISYSCDRIWRRHPKVTPTAVMTVQVLMTFSLFGYGFAMVLELCGRLSFLFAVGLNRISEFLLAISAVSHFMGLIVFTGEIKNRVMKSNYSADQSSWGFQLSAISVFLAVISTCLMSMFRNIPSLVNPRRRRFWKLPHSLQDSPPVGTLSLDPEAIRYLART